MADPIALQDFTGVLQNVYLPIRKKIFPINTVLLANARKLGPEHVTYAGNDLFFDVKVDRRGGFTSSTIGALPDSRVAAEKQGRLSIARTYAKAQVDGLALKANGTTRGSYISTAKKVVEDIMDQWQLEQERILQSDSLGIRALVTSGVASATQTVDSPYGISASGPGNLHLTVGDTVSFRSPDGVTLRGKRVITAISLSGDTATLTLDSSVTTTTGDVVVSAVPVAVHATDDSFGAEPHGLKSIMDVEVAFATFEGLSDNRWTAVKDTSGTIDEMIIMRHQAKIRARSGNDYQKNPRNTMLLTSPGIWLAYGESLLGLRRFAAPTMELKGGFGGVQVGNSTLIQDEWMPRKRVYSVYGPDTVFIDLMDFGEVSFQDAPKWQRAANFDRWEAAFASYWNYGVSSRLSQGVISGIADTVNFSPVF